MLIMRDETTILTFQNSPADQNGEIWINVQITKDNFIAAGPKQYQLFEGNILKESGTLEVVASLKVDPQQDLRGRYAIIVEAIEKQIAGIATKAQRHVQVGDKTIDKYNADDLLKLLDYFKGKLAEEESGSNINPETDEIKIKYRWSWR